MSKRTTIVTAIPYVNAVPHIGTALTTLSGDVTARYERMRGLDVFFVAGTDENGLKIKEAAEHAGKDVHEFVDDLVARYQSIFTGLHIRWDEFVRTTEERHKRATQEVFRRLQENGYIYVGKYEGWYDVTTETFFKESDLIDGKSPDGNEVRWVTEENYFFRLSAFGDRLLEHIENHPNFIVPESRRNEVISFIKQGLRDAAISRTNPGWGIPVPGREDQVVYVWFDAVINYITATGWPDDPNWEQKWPPIVQWIGKDILTRFHATLWPAMLMGLGAPLPECLAAHGWILLGGEKISKSKGNVIRPLELAEELATRSGCDPEVAIDAVRYYLTSTMNFEGDSTFTFEDFDRRYNSDLANDLGNALNRSLAMSHKFVGGVIPDAEPEAEAVAAIHAGQNAFDEAMQSFRLERAAEAAWGVVKFLNKYIDTRAPWALAKANDPALPGVMRSMLLCLRAAEAMVRPYMPVVADKIAEQLGLPPETSWDAIGKAESLPAGAKLEQPKPIFPRLDVTAARIQAPAKPEPKPKVKENKPVEPTPASATIAIEDFAKVELRVARVLEAEPVEGADKLLKVQVMIGDEKRQIVAGIRKNYSPEDLIGRQIVVVYNLKPAKLRGVESQGMLLAAVDADGGAVLLQPDKETPEGAKVR